MKWIKIDNGDTFEGTPDQFKDSFFDNITADGIIDWCNKNGMEVDIFNYIPKKNGEKNESI